MMQSSSSTSFAFKQRKHDVFVSFSGQDTRTNFTTHLYAALRRRKINTFVDNEALQRGNQIFPSLIDAIETSPVSIVIFSENYASSEWSLDELEMILECKKKFGQIVIPVFYHVEPSEVRKQTGSYGDALDEHEIKFSGRSDKLQKWRDALTEAASLSGYDTSVFRDESTLIEEIVQDILKKLNMSSFDKDDSLVGIDSKVKVIESLLCVGSMDFCVVGIWGFGGMGKTTLARAAFNKIFSRFDDAYFIENIREESSEKDPQLLSLTHQLSSATLTEETVEVLDESASLPTTKKLLIVFDDVTHPMQIESIIGPLQNWLNTGCKFIVTTREKQVLQHCCSEEKIYKLNELGDNEALQLFSRYAFKKEDPPMEFEAASKKVVEYTKGIPLALVVLGNFLFGKSKQEWESVMGMLDQNLSRGTQKVLKSKHDGEGGDIIKSGLDSEKSIGVVVKEFLNLVELIKSDALDCQKRNIMDTVERLGSGSTVVNAFSCSHPWLSDAESSSQQGNPNPGTDHEMPDNSVEQGGSDEQMISRRHETTPNLVGGSEPLSRSEMTQKEAKKRSGIPKWLGMSQRPSLTSQSKSSVTEELREIIKNQELQLTRKEEQLIQKEKQLTSMQEQVTRKDEQLGEERRRSNELAQMILNFNSTCQRMEDFMRHYGNDPPPPPPPPSTGSGSAMIS